MGRKLAFLLLLLAFGGSVETAWSVRNNVGIGPEGCRVFGGRFYGPSFTFDAEASRPLAEGTPVAIANEFGAVRVAAGAAGQLRVRLQKRVYRATREQAEEFARSVEIVLVEEAGRLRVSTNRDRLQREARHVGFETDLEVELPPGTRLDLGNSHGDVDVRDVAEAAIESSFGGLVAERVTGALHVKHRHGDVSVAEIGGDLVLEARHGDVSVRGVAGAAQLDGEHGDLQIDGAGSLRVKLAHGDLEAKTVGGDLVVEAVHAGVAAENVTGSARVTTSFDDIDVSGVAGDAELRSEHGQVTAREVKGAVTVEARFNGVTLEQIGGPVEVRVEHGGVTATGLGRGVKVTAEGDAVRLDRVRGPVEVRAQRGEVRVSPGEPITEPLTIQATHGAIHLDVPEGSRFDLDAGARHGDLNVDLPDAPEARHEGGTNVLTTKVGGGGARVHLRTEGGELTVVGGAGRASY